MTRRDPARTAPATLRDAARLAVLGLVAVAAVGCAGSGDGAPATAAEQIRRGERIWERACAQCHRAEEGIGSRLTPRVLASHGTAARLLDYNRDFMPYGVPGSLDPQEYVDVTAYLLAEHGFTGGTRILTPESAGEIELRP